MHALALTFLLLTPALLHAQKDPAPKAKPPYESDPKFLSAMSDGRQQRQQERASSPTWAAPTRPARSSPPASTTPP